VGIPEGCHQPKNRVGSRRVRFLVEAANQARIIHSLKDLATVAPRSCTKTHALGILINNKPWKEKIVRTHLVQKQLEKEGRGKKIFRAYGDEASCLSSCGRRGGIENLWGHLSSIAKTRYENMLEGGGNKPRRRWGKMREKET